MWQFTALSEYIKALASDPEPEKGLFRHVWDHYFSRQKLNEELEVESVSLELQSAPARLLDWVAPPPMWQDACGPGSKTDKEKNGREEGDETNAYSGDLVCEQLSLALTEWQGKRTQISGIQMLLAAPHSGVDEIMLGWARRQNYLVPKPPNRKQILDLNYQWLAELKARLSEIPENEWVKTRVVIVGLEEFFVRHHQGLSFLRQLIDYLATEAPPSLVVCNSWAWAYLRDAIHIDAMTRQPLTLGRCSGEALGAWLIELSSRSHHRKLTFRQGKEVFFSVGGNSLSEANPDAYSAFCRKLADLSRGNPGVARALWRRSVSIEASVDVHEQVQRAAHDDPGYTIWVQSIDQSTLPIVPSTFTNEDAFILQTLLIHNGLTSEMLQLALPLSAARISRRIQVMLNAGLIQCSDVFFDVSPLGYLPVRTFLRERGFFVDDL